MHSQIYNLFLDFGASYTKITAIDNQGAVILQRRVTAPALTQNGLEANFKNYDPLQYAKHAEAIYNQAVLELGLPSNIAVSGQVATYLILDELNRPITPIVSWQDTSIWFVNSGRNPSKISPKEAELVLSEDGVRPGLPALSIYTYLSSIAENTQGKKRYVPLTSYLLMSISGSLTPINIIHSSEAHSSGFYSLRNNAWSCTNNLKEHYPELIFPEVVHKPHFFFNDKKDCKWWLPIGDQQAAVYGSNVPKNTCIVHIATGGQVIKLSEELASDSGINFQIRPTLDGEGFLETVTHLPAGRLFNRVMSFLSNETGRQIDWNFLESIEREKMCEAEAKFDVVQMNLEQDNLPSLTRFNNSPTEYLSAFIWGVGSVYASKVKLLSQKELLNIHYSGGLICRSLNLQHAINLGIPNRKTSSSLEDDTSIAGLNKMVNAGY